MPSAGRPRLGLENRQRYNVMLEPRVAAHIRYIGGGNLSAGIYALVDANVQTHVQKTRAKVTRMSRRASSKDGRK
jgi:hypothetical protein